MNYLAHALLSGNDPEIIVGNFIADHLRGNDFSAFSPGIIKGIQMHRQIDHFTDSHELFRASKRIFYDGFEKHSGILVDIYFDHLLANNFQNFSAVNLNDFSNMVYEIYKNARATLPAGSNRFLDYVLKNNIYQSYSKQEGIETVLVHLSHRISHGVKLQESINLFTTHQESLNKNFKQFFSEAQYAFGK